MGLLLSSTMHEITPLGCKFLHSSSGLIQHLSHDHPSEGWSSRLKAVDGLVVDSSLVQIESPVPDILWQLSGPAHDGGDVKVEETDGVADTSEVCVPHGSQNSDTYSIHNFYVMCVCFNYHAI